jgi:aminodeoxyfutalosine synthase
MPVEQVVATARRAHDAGATEVHIVGGLHPWLKFDYYLDMLRGIRAACPGLHVKAFTAIEIVHFTRVARMTIRDVLVALKEAGLGSLPGGGAEIFDDRVHDEVFKGKVRADRWFDVHRTAHSLGIYSNATMLYGHVETPAERVAHLIKLRELQAESLASSAARFNCIIPLSFIPENSELGHLPGPTGLADLKTLAIARLMVPNIAHIKAFWIMQTPGLSQVALNWGCDDLDGTVVWYDITKRLQPRSTAVGGLREGERGTTHQELQVEDLKRLIREAGRVPVERDTLYRDLGDKPLVNSPALAGAR